MARTIRVYKREDGFWVAKQDGTSRASAVTYTQKEAYLAARNIALKQGLSITVYYPSGGIKAVINPRNRGEEESNCFITTSCVKYFGLKDDCYELQTLRKFRDNYLSNFREGKGLIELYYQIAPDLVKKLEVCPKKHVIYRTLFIQIKNACTEIENNNFVEATRIYKKVVTNLIRCFY